MPKQSKVSSFLTEAYKKSSAQRQIFLKLAQERPDVTSREKQIRKLKPEHDLNLKAVEAVFVIEKALKEQSVRVEFTIPAHEPPFFISNLIFGGVAGLKTNIACLEEINGDFVYGERVLILKFGIGDVKKPGDFLNALGAQRVSQIHCSFDAALEEPDTGIITLKGVKITSWEEKTP